MMGNNLWKARQGYCLGDRSQSWVAVPVLSFTQPARILLPCSTWRIFVSANSNSLGFYSFTSSFTSCFFISFSCVSVIKELVSLTILGYIHSWGAPKGSQVAIYFVDFLSRLACWVTCLQLFHYQNFCTRKLRVCIAEMSRCPEADYYNTQAISFKRISRTLHWISHHFCKQTKTKTIYTFMRYILIILDISHKYKYVDT